MSSLLTKLLQQRSNRTISQTVTIQMKATRQQNPSKVPDKAISKYNPSKSKRLKINNKKTVTKTKNGNNKRHQTKKNEPLYINIHLKDFINSINRSLAMHSRHFLIYFILRMRNKVTSMCFETVWLASFLTPMAIAKTNLI